MVETDRMLIFPKQCGMLICSDTALCCPSCKSMHFIFINSMGRSCCLACHHEVSHSEASRENVYR